MRVERLAEPAPDLAPGAAAATKRLAFLCLSRVALRDPATGQPTLLPTADAFGIAQPNWVFNERLSFVRTTRYAPFSGKLQRPDLERHVLERGSVVVFTGDAPESPEAVRARLAGGVGLYRNQGLGDVSVAPEWLTARIPKAPTEVVRTATRTTPPSDALFAWASAERDVRAAARTAVEWAEEKARSLARHQLPPAQWGRVRTLAREARIRGDGQWLKRQLDELMRADTPLDRPDDPAKKRVDDRTRQQKSTVGSRLWASARPELLSLFPEASPEKAAEWTAMPERIEMLASRAMRSGTESQREGGR